MEDDFAEGYRDGRDLSTPEPSANRSACYRHSWHVGRAERTGSPIPAPVARQKAQEAIEREQSR